MQVATTIDGDTGMVVKRLSVPVGLEELMESLTKQVLMKKPKDLFTFASEHFAHLVAIREKLNAHQKQLQATADTQQLRVKSVTSATRFNKLPTPVIFTNSKTPRTVATTKAFRFDEKKGSRLNQQSLIKDVARKDATVQKERARWRTQPPLPKEEVTPSKRTPREIREAYTFRKDDSKQRRRDRVDGRDDKLKLRTTTDAGKPSIKENVDDKDNGKSRREPAKRQQGATPRITPRTKSSDSSSSSISVHGKTLSKSSERLMRQPKGKNVAKVAPTAVGVGVGAATLVGVDLARGKASKSSKSTNKESQSGQEADVKQVASNTLSESGTLSDRSDRSKSSQESQSFKDSHSEMLKTQNHILEESLLEADAEVVVETDEDVLDEVESISGSVVSNAIVGTSLSGDIEERVEDMTDVVVPENTQNEERMTQNEDIPIGGMEESGLETVPEAKSVEPCESSQTRVPGKSVETEDVKVKSVTEVGIAVGCTLEKVKECYESNEEAEKIDQVLIIDDKVKDFVEGEVKSEEISHHESKLASESGTDEKAEGGKISENIENADNSKLMDDTGKGFAVSADKYEEEIKEALLVDDTSDAEIKHVEKPENFNIQTHALLTVDGKQMTVRDDEQPATVDTEKTHKDQEDETLQNESDRNNEESPNFKHPAETVADQFKALMDMEEHERDKEELTTDAILKLSIGNTTSIDSNAEESENEANNDDVNKAKEHGLKETEEKDEASSEIQESPKGNVENHIKLKTVHAEENSAESMKVDNEETNKVEEKVGNQNEVMVAPHDPVNNDTDDEIKTDQVEQSPGNASENNLHLSIAAFELVPSSDISDRSGNEDEEGLVTIAKTPSVEFPVNDAVIAVSGVNVTDVPSSEKIDDEGPLSIEDVSKYLNKENQENNQQHSEYLPKMINHDSDKARPSTPVDENTTTNSVIKQIDTIDSEKQVESMDDGADDTKEKLEMVNDGTEEKHDLEAKDKIETTIKENDINEENRQELQSHRQKDVYMKLSDSIDKEINDVLEKLEYISIPDDEPDHHDIMKHSLDFTLAEDHSAIVEDLEAVITKHIAEQVDEALPELHDIQEENEEEVDVAGDPSISSDLLQLTRSFVNNEKINYTVSPMPLPKDDNAIGDQVTHAALEEDQQNHEEVSEKASSDLQNFAYHIATTRSFVNNEKVNYDTSVITSYEMDTTAKQDVHMGEIESSHKEEGKIVSALGAVGGFFASKSRDFRNLLSPRSKSPAEQPIGEDERTFISAEDTEQISQPEKSIRIRLTDNQSAPESFDGKENYVTSPLPSKADTTENDISSNFAPSTVDISDSTAIGTVNDSTAGATKNLSDNILENVLVVENLKSGVDDIMHSAEEKVEEESNCLEMLENTKDKLNNDVLKIIETANDQIEQNINHDIERNINHIVESVESSKVSNQANDNIQDTILGITNALRYDEEIIKEHVDNVDKILSEEISKIPEDVREHAIDLQNKISGTTIEAEIKKHEDLKRITEQPDTESETVKIIVDEIGGTISHTLQQGKNKTDNITNYIIGESKEIVDNIVDNATQLKEIVEITETNIKHAVTDDTEEAFDEIKRSRRNISKTVNDIETYVTDIGINVTDKDEQVEDVGDNAKNISEEIDDTHEEHLNDSVNDLQKDLRAIIVVSEDSKSNIQHISAKTKDMSIENNENATAIGADVEHFEESPEKTKKEESEFLHELQQGEDLELNVKDISDEIIEQIDSASHKCFGEVKLIEETTEVAVETKEPVEKGYLENSNAIKMLENEADVEVEEMKEDISKLQDKIEDTVNEVEEKTKNMLQNFIESVDETNSTLERTVSDTLEDVKIKSEIIAEEIKAKSNKVEDNLNDLGEKLNSKNEHMNKPEDLELVNKTRKETQKIEDSLYNEEDPSAKEDANIIKDTDEQIHQFETLHITHISQSPSLEGILQDFKDAIRNEIDEMVQSETPGTPGEQMQDQPDSLEQIAPSLSLEIAPNSAKSIEEEEPPAMMNREPIVEEPNTQGEEPHVDILIIDEVYTNPLDTFEEEDEEVVEGIVEEEEHDAEERDRMESRQLIQGIREELNNIRAIIEKGDEIQTEDGVVITEITSEDESLESPSRHNGCPEVEQDSKDTLDVNDSCSNINPGRLISHDSSTSLDSVATVVLTEDLNKFNEEKKNLETQDNILTNDIAENRGEDIENAGEGDKSTADNIIDGPVQLATVQSNESTTDKEENAEDAIIAALDENANQDDVIIIDATQLSNKNVDDIKFLAGFVNAATKIQSAFRGFRVRNHRVKKDGASIGNNAEQVEISETPQLLTTELNSASEVERVDEEQEENVMVKGLEVNETEELSEKKNPPLGQFLKSLSNIPKPYLASSITKTSEKNKEIEETSQNETVNGEILPTIKNKDEDEMKNDATDSAPLLPSTEPFFLHDPAVWKRNPIADAIQMSSEFTHQEANIRLLHSGEFHDALPMQFDASVLNEKWQSNLNASDKQMAQDVSDTKAGAERPVTTTATVAAASRSARTPTAAAAAAAAAVATPRPIAVSSPDHHSVTAERLSDDDAQRTAQPPQVGRAAHAANKDAPDRQPEEETEAGAHAVDNSRREGDISGAAADGGGGAQPETRPSAAAMDPRRNNATITERNAESQAATKIQSGNDVISPKRNARRKTSGGRAPDSKKLKDDINIEDKSATKIQAGVRGFLVRRRNQKKRENEEV